VSPATDISETNTAEILEKGLAQLEASASSWRILGWLFVVVSSIFIFLLITATIGNLSKTNQIPLIWWLLPIWADASGVVFLYVHRKLKDLQLVFTVMPSTLTLISELRGALSVYLYLLAAFVLGCLIIYPQTVIVLAGTVFVVVKPLLADRTLLQQLEERIKVASGA
jgi:hypothetical protein